MPAAPDDPADAQFVIYFILISVSIIANSLVVWSLVKLSRSSTCFTYLLSYLHGTTVIEQILLIPYLYKGNYRLCLAVQGFQCFVSLMNILTVALLVEAHLSTIFEDPYDLKSKIVKYGKYLLYGFPCIVFLGYANNTFSHPHCAFCTVPSSLSSITFLFFYYLEIWAALLYSSLRMIVSFIRIYRIDRVLASKYFSSIGFYIIVAIVGWLPRSIIRFTNPYAEDDDGNHDDNSHANALFLVAFYPLVLTGLLFAYLYFRESASIRMFAASVRQTSAFTDNDETFSWDEILKGDNDSISSISSPQREGGRGYLGFQHFLDTFRGSEKRSSKSEALDANTATNHNNTNNNNSGKHHSSSSHQLPLINLFSQKTGSSAVPMESPSSSSSSQPQQSQQAKGTSSGGMAIARSRHNSSDNPLHYTNTSNNNSHGNTIITNSNTNNSRQSIPVPPFSPPLSPESNNNKKKNNRKTNTTIEEEEGEEKV